MVFGLPGSGKSNFCSRLAKLTGFPLHHLDKIYFNPGWVAKDREVFRKHLAELVAAPAWIIDGNCMRSIEVRYQKADIAIFFNFPLPLCLYRVTKRVFFQDKHLKDLPVGCSKSIRYPLLRYLIAFRRRYGKEIKRLQNAYPHAQFLEFRSDKDVQNFLNMQ